ncbi:serine/threonine-protein kinase [Archangium gephyra]|uniref:non-specific serine/threonine protein kinase n=1 Tax=Archangium gephyra TaxID=48 RepID=A0AAC8QG51_9BACT|nr:serine/threonine-protein kinase [Archangium gephyra]AKJ07113.1 Serine/threonine protein kinase PrkC, regulator of stationary phase [Archangium gephyra]REG26526.1 serine/threonine-protein kinase [Archangium gephyra]
MVQSGAQPQSAPADVGDPLIGRVLNDKFRIVEALGSGGMGRVYKAVQSPLERLVALKVLNPQYSEGKDPGFQKRFFLEAAVTSKLRHPNTVTIIDYGRTDDGVLYIAMEYLEGQTLAQLLTQQGPLPYMRVMNIAQQVARSLREAHRVGLIHRDLKPANIMVLNQEDDHDVVKVLDFGLVKSFLPDRGGTNETEITQAGVILGSPQYMAPEQARNVSDPRSDVYSLGVVMFQMLMGRPPFQAAQSIDVIFKHLNEAPPIFAAVWPGHSVPQEVEALVMRCLYKRPEERFQSMDEVLEAIRRAAASAGFSGAFSSPRNAVTSGFTALPVPGSGPLSGPQTGPLPSPGSTGASTVALDIAVEEMPAKPASRRTLPLALFAGSLLLGLTVAAVVAVRAPAPQPLPAPEPTQAVAPAVKTPAPEQPAAEQPAPEQPAAAAEAAPAVPAQQPAAEPAVVAAAPAPAEPVAILFVIDSEPAGAKVLYGGRVLGQTPLELPVPPGANGRASARLTFALEGYQRATAIAAGEGPVVRHTQKLKKKSGSRSASDRNSAGYKDDPY